jgi:hypothetical protein
VKVLATRPMCAVCGRIVERMEEEDDGEEVVFTASCHGQRERVRLRAEEARLIGKLSFGVAFASAPRRLEPSTS